MDAPAVEPYSASDLRQRVERRNISGDGSGYFGNHRSNRELQHPGVRDGLRDAAVLIPVVDRTDGASIILTKRTEKLRHHSGQVAFPGGSIDPTDASPEEAALRETEEEIGLDRSFVKLIGRLPDDISGSGFRVAPMLGIVRPGFLLTLNVDEVDDAFEVPLGFLMNEANHSRESREWQGRMRHYYVMPYGDHYIWGMTAGIIRVLYERLYA
jgi:8-oxo-dGTP pyrophosphatase MutT (NUDIX family)